jgi:uncharacterized membrane protein
MNINKRFNTVRSLVTFFVAVTVAVAVIQNSYFLAVAGVVTGMLFIIVIRSKAKITVDEREKTVREKAAQLTYAIFAPTIGLNAFVLTMIGRNNSAIMATGQTLSYLTLFLIILYAISYRIVNRKLGGGDINDKQT